MRLMFGLLKESEGEMTQAEVWRKWILAKRLYEWAEKSNDYALIHHYCYLTAKYQELYYFSYSHPQHFAAGLFP